MKTNYNFDKSAYYGSKHEQFLLFRKNKLLMTRTNQICSPIRRLIKYT